MSQSYPKDIARGFASLPMLAPTVSTPDGTSIRIRWRRSSQARLMQRTTRNSTPLQTSVKPARTSLSAAGVWSLIAGAKGRDMRTRRSSAPTRSTLSPRCVVSWRNYRSPNHRARPHE